MALINVLSLFLYLFLLLGVLLIRISYDAHNIKTSRSFVLFSNLCFVSFGISFVAIYLWVSGITSGFFETFGIRFVLWQGWFILIMSLPYYSVNFVDESGFINP